MNNRLLATFLALGCILHSFTVAHGRPWQSSQPSASAGRQLQSKYVIKSPAGLQAVSLFNPLKQLGQGLSELPKRVVSPTAALRAPASLLKPFTSLASALDKVEAALPDIEFKAGSNPGVAELPDKHAQLPSAATNPKLTAAASMLAAQEATLSAPHESVSTATGMAFNGGKASAKAAASAQTASSSAAQASAVAIADRTAAAQAQASSDASNPANKGLSVAQATTTAVSDKSSLVVSMAGSLSVGLGGDMTASDTVSEGAATGSSIAYVGSTAVSSAGPGSSSNTTSYGTAAADKNAVAATRADSITLAFFKGGKAEGTATANSQASDKGVAASQSLMESFAILGGKSEATSKADATAAQPGASLVRDKAVAIGLSGADAAAHTESAGGAGKLGLAVIDSVVRSITTSKQKSCGDAVTRTFSDLASGAQIDLGTFIMELGHHADPACVSSFKDHAGAKLAEQQLRLPSFDTVSDAVSKNTAGLTKTAGIAVNDVHNWVAAPLEQVTELIRRATWGCCKGSMN